MRTINLECHGFAIENECLKTLPYGYIDKTLPGCGLTTVALEDSEDIIIAVPRITLIENKISQYPNKRCTYNILGVYDKISNIEISNYVNDCNKNNQPLKIMVTYDSLPKCQSLMDRCHIVIDESDMLIRDKQFKREVSKRVFPLLEAYKDNLSFISATPLPLEYFPQWVSELQQVKLYWDNQTLRECYEYCRSYPLKALTHEILQPLLCNNLEVEGIKVDKVLVFINSISNAVKVCKELKLSTVGFICGDTLTNDTKIEKYGERITYENTNGYTNLPIITFVTSTGWQGIDLYDRNCMNIIVSNATNDKAWRIVDTSTELIQAVSRIRNSKYVDYVLIHNNAKQDKSLEEIYSLKDRVCQVIERFNSDPTSSIYEEFMNEVFNEYAYKEDDIYRFDDIRFGADLFMYNKTKNMNAVAISGAGIVKKVIEKPIYKTDTESFAYVKEHFFDDNINKESEMYQLIRKAYDKTGEFYTNAHYTRKIAESNNILLDSIKIDMMKRFQLNYWFKDTTTIKSILQSIYDKHGITRKAKATDLKEIGLNTKRSQKNGVSGILITN